MIRLKKMPKVAGVRSSRCARAVDNDGKTVDFLLRPDCSIAAAQAFFRKALSTRLPRWPRKIALDGHKQSNLALWLLRREGPKWKFVQVWSSQYLNNLC
jgi:transposase-like protein